MPTVGSTFNFEGSTSAFAAAAAPITFCWFIKLVSLYNGHLRANCYRVSVIKTNERIQVVFVTTDSVEMSIIFDGLLADVAHLGATRACHLIASFLFEETGSALPALPEIKYFGFSYKLFTIKKKTNSIPCAPFLEILYYTFQFSVNLVQVNIVL